MKKIVNVSTLIVMVCVNILNPFTYAGSLGDDFLETEKIDEIIQETETFNDEENIEEPEIEQENKNIQNNEENKENEHEKTEDLEENNSSDQNLQENNNTNNDSEDESNDEGNQELPLQETENMEENDNSNHENLEENLPIIDENLSSICDETDLDCIEKIETIPENSTIQPDLQVENLKESQRDLDLFVSEYSITFDTDGGSNVSSITNLAEGTDISKLRPADPNKAGNMFLGWFIGNNRFEFEGQTITSDINLTAHWASFGKLNFTGVVNGEMTTITIMDRNVGAENVGDFGYYYQWGNNHGFTYPIASNDKKDQRVSASGHSWSNPFYSKYFIKNGTNWLSTDNNDLWGGANDIIGNKYDDGGIRNKRQGPCPSGYHVPSLKEWFNVVDILFQRYDVTEVTIGGDSYPIQVGKNPGSNFDSVKYPLDADDYSSIEDELKISYNGRLGRTDGGRNREGGGSDPRAYLWTSSINKTENSDQGIYVIEFGLNNKLVGVGGFSEKKSMGFGVRCFKDESDMGMIRFNLNGGIWSGSNPEYISYQKSQGITLPSDEPEMNEKVFDGWYTDNETFLDEIKDGDYLNGNVTLYAKYRDETKYNVYFIVDGTIKSTQVAEGKNPTYNYIERGEPTKPDHGTHYYIFEGWYDGTDYYLSGEELPPVTADVTYTATFGEYITDKYRVTFDTDGDGIEDIEEYVDQTEGNNFIDLPVPPARDGYTFTGWKTGDEEPIAAGTEYIVTGDINFVAQWELTQYTIIYDYTGGTAPSQTNPTNYNVENDTVTIYSPTRTDYKFIGWKEYVCNKTNEAECSQGDRTFVRDILVDEDSATIKIWNTGHKKYVAQWTENGKKIYVIWLDEDHSYLGISSVTSGTQVSTIDNIPNPSKEPDAKYSYNFIGWTKEGQTDTVDLTNEFVTDNIIYYAKYDKTINKYKVKFFDEDGITILPVGGENFKEYFYDTPATNILTPANPTKDDSDEWDYEFDKWTPEIVDVAGDAEYRATYTQTKQKYEVTFVDENGTTILQGATLYEYGTSPIYTGETPTKPDDEQGHTFEFESWYDGTNYYLSGQELSPVMGNVIYTAVYASNTSQYDIVFNPNEGEINSISKTVTYGQEYGELPIPERKGYEFLGWYTDPTAGTQITSGTIVGITAKNQTLYAHWNMKTYSVSYFDKDEEHPMVVTGATTEYSIDSTITIPIPTKEGYTFIGWKEIIDGVYTRAYLNEGNSIIIGTGNVGDRKYIALWNEEGHVVVWENWDGVILDMNIGISPDTYASTLEPLDHSKPADAQYTYTFIGWTKNGEPVDLSTERVTEDVRYKATYSGNINKYGVIFLDEDGTTVLKPATEYEYGTPAANIEKPANPTKEDSEEWDYEFAGWSPEISEVITGATYTATYTQTKQKYEITFFDENGTTVLKEATLYEYGTAARDIDTPDKPTKQATEGYTYTFSGWSPTLREVTGNQNYTAIYTSIPNQYIITFDTQGGTFASGTNNIVTYGETYGILPTPMKNGNNFLGWYTDVDSGTKIMEDTIVEITGNQVLYAHWEKQTYNIMYFDKDEEHPITVTGATTQYTVDNSIIIPNITKNGYTFVGWKEVVYGEPAKAYLSDGTNPTIIPKGKIGDRKYIALWNQHGYIIVWTNDDNTILEIDPDVGYGNTPEYNGDTPTKAETEEYTYTFAGWTPTVEPATQRQTYKAIFTPHKQSYLIKFVDSETTTGKYEYGTTAEQLRSVAPTLFKTGDYECETYEGRWTPELEKVTGPVTYTSSYVCLEKRKYTIIWKNWNGTPLEIDPNAEYGSIPTYHSTTPKKEISDGKIYTFYGWEDEEGTVYPTTDPLPIVTGDVSYIATFTDDPNTYGVEFNPKGGTVNPSYKTVKFEYQYGELPIPVRDGYDFDGWYDAENGGHKILPTTTFTLTGNQTLYAHWNLIPYNIIYENVPLNYTGPTSYTIQTSIEIPNPTKEGHKFIGWKEYVENKDYVEGENEQWIFVKDILKSGNNTILSEGNVGNRKYVAQWEVIDYTITWISNGQLLKVNMLPYGSIPVYTGEIPTMESDAQYTYEFTGWSDGNTEYGKNETLPEVDGSVTYSARFSKTINKYTIKFVNENGTPLQATDLEYGEMPSYDTGTYGIPTKTGDTQYTYEFVGWSPEISEVTTGVTYTATYSGTLNKYEVTFVDEDGTTILKSATRYEYGTPAANIEKPDNPTKTGDAQYTYEFVGWTPEISEVTTGRTYTATYSGTLKQYTVTFDSDGGSPIDSITVNYGTGIEAPEKPTKRGYTFLKWQKVEGQEITDYDFETPITQNIILKALWIKDEYTVVYKDGEDTLAIEGATTGYTITDEIIIPNPEKTGYTFVGWKEYIKTGENTRNFVKDILKDGESITIGTGNVGDREYRAQWRINQYTVIFLNYDRSILKVEILNYGSGVIYNKSYPTRIDETGQYTYTFSGWEVGDIKYGKDETLPNVTGNVTYVAYFEESINKYEVTFVDEDGTTVLKPATEYEYGTTATDIEKPADPSKEDSEEWDYEFAGWTPEIGLVTGNQTYTATYTQTKQKYEIVFVDEDGTTILKDATQYEYGTDPRLIEKPDNPIKAATDEYTYIFSGWIPEIVTVTTGATYKATYSGIANQYTIIFDTQGESTGTTKVVTYGEKYGELPTPTKPGNEFLGWYTDPTTGTQITSGTTVDTLAKNQTLYAHREVKNYTVLYFDQDGTTQLIIPSATTGYTVNDSIIIPNPTKEEYMFVGWKEYVDGVYTRAYLNEGTGIVIGTGNVGNREYVAQWNKSTNGYVVLWIDWNNVIIDMNTDVGYGTLIANITRPDNPTRIADAQYTYTFANWTKNDVDIADITSEIITGNTRYKAKYNETINKYKVTFVDEDGTTVLKEEKEYNYGTTVENIEKPAVHIKTGWKFSGWNPTLSMVAENVIYKAVYEINQYTIAFDTNGGSVIAPITQDYNTPINISNPTKEGYTFKGWIPNLPSNMPAENIVVVAQWEKSGGDEGGSGGGGGGGSSSGGGGGKSSKKSSTGDVQENTNNNVEENTHSSAGDEGNEEIGGADQNQGNINSIIDSEGLAAYEWARNKSITTINSIELADPDGYVTRGHLAKMLVNFVVNVLGRSIPYDVSYDCVNWNDDPLIWESDEIRDYATKACALGIMGINTWNNEFRPNDIVTRAEFGTVASRILWGDTYNELDTDNNLFYTKHLNALQKNGFMKDIDNPLGRREIRKRVRVVLKRIELEKNRE